MPANPEQAVDAVVHAVLNGTLRRQRIDERPGPACCRQSPRGFNRRRFRGPEAAMDGWIHRTTWCACRRLPTAPSAREEPVTRCAAQGSAACFLVPAQGRYSNEGKVFCRRGSQALAQRRDSDLDPSGQRRGIRGRPPPQPAIATRGRGGFRFAGRLSRRDGAARRLPATAQRAARRGGARWFCWRWAIHT